jgi:hypothetical protein
MLVDSLRTPMNNWKYSEEIKIGHLLGWIDDFIAANKESELIK